VDRDTGRKVVKSLQSLLSRTLTASRRISQYVLLEDNAERFCRFLVSMMLAPSIPQVLKELRPDGGGEFLGSFTVTVYIPAFNSCEIGKLQNLYSDLQVSLQSRIPISNSEIQ
jgi:hypothetical protein